MVIVLLNSNITINIDDYLFIISKQKVITQPWYRLDKKPLATPRRHQLEANIGQGIFLPEFNHE